MIYSIRKLMVQKYFFQFSKNGRRDKTTKRKNKRQWAKPNNSTMNRICRAFDDIGNINMNWAGIPPFNWQMMLSESCYENRPDIISEFCDLDNIKVSLAISDAEENPTEKDIINKNSIIDEYIVDTLTRKFGSIKECYPYLVKYLFMDNVNKASHKQTFWRVFGDIAVENIQKNKENCTECKDCGAKIPKWAAFHDCPKNSQGFYNCICCGKLCQRTNSKQKRCPECQEHYRHDMRLVKNKKTKKENEERDQKFTTFSQSRYKKT